MIKKSSIKNIQSGDLVARVNLKGGYLESLKLKNLPLLFERSDLVVKGEQKNRGGVYVCAPFFGPAPTDIGPQHGYSRSVDWIKVQEDLNRIVLSYTTTDEVFDGLHHELEWSIEQRSKISILKAVLEITNNSSKNKPIAPAFHPYFPASGPLESINYGDNTKKIEANHDFSSVIFVKTKGETIHFETNNQSVTVETDNLPIIALWSDTVNKYICVEPSNRGFQFEYGLPDNETLILKPGEKRRFVMQITWDVTTI